MELNRYKIRISPAALADFDEALAYIKEKLKNTGAARTLYTEFNDALDRISLYPYAMARVSNRRVTEKEYRKIIIRNFIALYRIDEDVKEIHIMAFRYAPSSLGDMI